MIKWLTAYTREADDPEKAVGEIQKQLDFEHEGLVHSVALLFCYTDFITSGVMEAVSNSLPCKALGCTSQYFALNSAEDEIMLIVTVLTSDDTEFAAGVSEALTPDSATDQVRALYQKIAAVSTASPSMIFAIQPTMLTLGGDVLSAALDQASGGKIPVFGTCAIDMAQKIRCPQIMYQGRAYGDRMALLFFKGPVQPRFFASLFPEQFFLTQDAVITGVSGTRITTINNIPAASFLEDLGLLQGGPVKITSAIPLVIHYIDGSSRQVVILSDITPEGAVISNRNVRVGGELKLGAITADHILESVRVLVRDIKQNGNGAGLFMFSCFMRTVATGGNSMAEIGEIQKEFAGFPQPYILCYSGGELCPQYTEAGGMRNRFYQYALIACQL